MNIIFIMLSCFYIIMVLGIYLYNISTVNVFEHVKMTQEILSSEIHLCTWQFDKAEKQTTGYRCPRD